MEEQSGVLVQNEKHANKSVAKVMRITFFIFSAVFLLNVLGIFVVDMTIMTIAYIGGSILLWFPTAIVNIAKLEGVYVKYMLAVCAVIFVTIVTSTLGYHAVLLYIYAIAIAAIFTMLCERTAGMLSNLMNAEEQEQMIQDMRLMHEKSQKARRNPMSRL